MIHSIRQRRLKAKTDYKARLALLKSDKPRLVIRKTNKYMTAQLVESNLAQDKVLFGLTSKALLSKGWPKEKAGSLKSLPAAYLTGLLLGKTAKSKVKEAILDLGMYRNIQKSRIYAVLKGVIDSGLKISCNEKVLPSEKELNVNPELNKFFDKVKSNI